MSWRSVATARGGERGATRAPIVDTSRALQTLDDGSEMARVREYGIVSQIGIELGFDGNNVFRRAAPVIAGKSTKPAAARR